MPVPAVGLPFTVVEVAEVPRIQEEVGPEEVAEATPTGSEGQRGVEVQTSSPVALPSQVVSCHIRTASTDHQNPSYLPEWLRSHEAEPDLRSVDPDCTC